LAWHSCKNSDRTRARTIAMIVSKSRSLVKSLTWRVVALITTFISIYIVSGELSVAWFGTLLTNFVNFILYYVHERVWNKTSWGRK
jgi:adenylylsulfate kinase